MTNSTLYPHGDPTIKPDWITALLVFLLAATLYAFFADIFPYPYGWIVLIALLALRLTRKQQRE